MTHNDIYTKFLIEYDKTNVTSSYPLLTKYEVATLLDRAYVALISRKITGNNPRRSIFESDIKAIEDLRPLIVTKGLSPTTAVGTADNEFVYKLPSKTEMLYFVEGLVDYTNSINAADGKKHKTEVANLSDHRTAQKFMATNSNLPWIKQPVVFLEGNNAHLLIDTYKHKGDSLSFYATYLKLFAKFAKSITSSTDTATQEDKLETVELLEQNTPQEQLNSDTTQQVTPVTPTTTYETVNKSRVNVIDNYEFNKGFAATYIVVGDYYDIIWNCDNQSTVNSWPTNSKILLEIALSGKNLGKYKYITLGDAKKSGQCHINMKDFKEYHSLKLLIALDDSTTYQLFEYKRNNTKSFTISIEGAPKDHLYLNLTYFVLGPNWITLEPPRMVQNEENLLIYLDDEYSWFTLTALHIKETYPDAKIKWDNGSELSFYNIYGNYDNTVKVKVEI